MQKGPSCEDINIHTLSNACVPTLAAPRPATHHSTVPLQAAAHRTAMTSHAHCRRSLSADGRHLRRGAAAELPHYEARVVVVLVAEVGDGSFHALVQCRLAHPAH